jgi:thioredoxin reductase (NADPH)
MRGQYDCDLIQFRGRTWAVATCELLPKKIMSTVTIYGATWCPDCRRSKKFLTEQRIPFKWIDIEEHPEHQEYVERVNDGKRIIPTIVFEDGSILVEPSDAQLATKLGLTAQAKQSLYDVIVIGGGPTGLTTALYAAREGMEVLVVAARWGARPV